VRLLEGARAVDGASVSYELAPSPEIVAAKVLSGELDFAALPTNMAAKIYSGGVRYKLAALIGFGVLYVVGSDATVASWKDLKGRSVAASGRGSTADIAFRYLLARNGLDPDRDLALRYFPPLELAQLVIVGREPLAVLPEPFVTKVLLQKPGARVALDAQAEWLRMAGPGAPLAMSALVVKADTAQRAPRLVSDFLRLYAGSVAWVNDHPKEAGPLVEQAGIGFTAAEAERAIPRCNIRFVPAPQARGAVEAFLQVLLSFSPDAIGGRLPDDAFYLEE
jgi:NitT/TauT family transport system substrate-binding protein